MLVQTKNEQLRENLESPDNQNAAVESGWPLCAWKGTLAAQSYADIIFTYWLELHLTGTLHANEPLLVLDPHCGDGRFAYALLYALQEKMAGGILADYRFHLLAADHDEQTIARLQEHPWLQEHLHSGLLEIAQWDAKNWPFAEAINPAVIIAHGLFHQLPVDLYQFHFGNTFHAEKRPDPEKGGESFYWEPCALDLSSKSGAVLEQYRRRLEKTPLVWPTGACAFMDTLHAWCGGRFLLLAIDEGYHHEMQVRAQGLPPLDSNSDFAAPVNFHALAEYQGLAGGWSLAAPYGQRNMVIQATLASPQDLPGMVRQKIRETLQRFHAGDFAQSQKRLAQDAPSLSPDQWLVWLRQSAYDPELLLQALPHLERMEIHLDTESWWRWHEALQKSWQHYLPRGEAGGFWYGFGLLCMRLGYWGLAIPALEWGVHAYESPSAVSELLAWCYQKTGQTAQALRVLEETALTEARQTLTERLERWQERGWTLAESGTPATLALEPLDECHGEDFALQYRDPNIGIMTRLPELKAGDEFQKWLADELQESGRFTYAVMHRYWGFVGVANLSQVGDSGYFYFWIGADFQNLGMGQIAAQLLFVNAQSLGTRTLFTSAFRDNHRSQYALEKVGFEKLAIRAQEPDDDLIFYGIALSGEEARKDLNLEKLQEVLQGTGSGFVVE
jgi:RimJ/RimL family protein N-acetyltransferase